MRFDIKKRIIFSITFSVLLIAIFLVLLDHFLKFKKNDVDYLSIPFVQNEMSKNVAEEVDYINAIYKKNESEVGVEKWKLLENFKSAVVSGKQKFLTQDEMFKMAMRFPDTVIVGDSIAEQLKYNIFTDTYHVKSRIGANIGTLKEEFENAKAQYPKNIIIFKGLNDVAFYPNITKYVEALALVINDLQESLPGVNIYICSTLPASSALLVEKPYLAGSDTINEATKLVCEKTGVNYVDIAFMLTGDEMRYEDGMHFKNAFYNYWIQYMHLLINC